MESACTDVGILVRKRVAVQNGSRKKMKVIVSNVITLISMIGLWYQENFMLKEPSIDRDEERRCFLNRLYNGREEDCIEQLRLSKSSFLKLCNILQEMGGLIPTANVKVEEAVAMFLHILAHNLKFRVIRFNYFRSKETISRQFKGVLHAMMRINNHYLKLHENNISCLNSERWKWFENCLGALDGNHISVTVSEEDRPRYRNRKGGISTNVLAACNPDMLFNYMLPGWEGSASDSRVLRDALRRRHHLQIPNGKYYLVDAGYTNGPGFLAPYRGTRYHLNEWTGRQPENYKELFNLRPLVQEMLLRGHLGC